MAGQLAAYKSRYLFCLFGWNKSQKKASSLAGILIPLGCQVLEGSGHLNAAFYLEKSVTQKEKQCHHLLLVFLNLSVYNLLLWSEARLQTEKKQEKPQGH